MEVPTKVVEDPVAVAVHSGQVVSVSVVSSWDVTVATAASVASHSTVVMVVVRPLQSVVT